MQSILHSNIHLWNDFKIRRIKVINVIILNIDGQPSIKAVSPNN